MIPLRMKRYGTGTNEMVQYFSNIVNLIALLLYKFCFEWSCYGSWTIPKKRGSYHYEQLEGMKWYNLVLKLPALVPLNGIQPYICACLLY